MLINYVPTQSCLVISLPSHFLLSHRLVHLRLLWLAHVRGFKEATERLEEPHNFRLAQDVRKYFEICAEARKSVKVKQSSCLVGIVKIEGHHGPVCTAEQVDYLLVFEYLHEL